MVTILMATYNGARYLESQLESIVAQSYTDWRLYIRDDNSTDESIEIIKTYQDSDSRILLIDYGKEHGSATINFSLLFDFAYQNLSLSYIMFADQDDIWKENKVKDSLLFIQGKEAFYGLDKPLLVYSSFQYVDEFSNVINQEMVLPSRLSINNLLSENHAYGCTMILNHALIKKIVRIPVNAENHDYWVALVASCFGFAIHNPKKLILYRQHSNNVSGNVKSRTLSSRIYRYFKHTDFLLPVLTRNFIMINLFLITYYDQLDLKHRKLIEGYIMSFRKNTPSLLIFMANNSLKKLGLLQTIAHWYTLSLIRSKIVKDA